MDVKERCPACKGRLFMTKLDGSRICAQCGHVMSPGNARPESTPAKSEPVASGISCPMCGSQAKLVRYDPDGAAVYQCPLCGNGFRKEPAPNAPRMPAGPVEKKLDGREIFKMAIQQTVEVSAYNKDGNGSTGTGFFIANEYVLTNAHVIYDDLGAKKPVVLPILSINFKDGDEIKAEHVCSTTYEDMALLRVKKFSNSVATIAKEMPETGETVYTVGNSRGDGLCILEGVVSDQLRTWANNLPFMMTSLNTVGGNSGGPIFSTKGEVVGIQTQGRGDSVAMKYAIPVPRIRKFLEEAIKQAHLPIKLK